MNKELEKKMEEACCSLSDADPRLRLKAVRRLTGIAVRLAWEERHRIVEELAKLAGDKEPFIRWNVAMALGRIGHESGVDALERMAGDEHANLRFRVALSLGLIGDPAGIPILERYVEDSYKIGEHAVVRAFAAIALGQIGDPAGVPLLSRLACDPDPAVRWHAAVALGEVGLREGVSILSMLTEDPVPFVRGHTAIALAQIGDPDGLPILERALRYTAEQAQTKPTPAEQKMKGVCEKALESLTNIVSAKSS